MGGLCECFGSRKGKKLVGDEGTETNDKLRPPGRSDLSSSARAKKSEIKQETVLPKDGPAAHGKARTFAYQELKDATKNFRPETFVGEGGFGSVYEGQIASTGQVRPMLRDRRNYSQLADPHLKGQFSEPILRRAVEVASMCVREVATTRPSMSDIVLALNFLLSHPYEPNSAPSHCAERSEFKERQEDANENCTGEGYQRITKEERRHENKRDLTRLVASDVAMKETTRMLNKDLDRERAVADAKMWGESWREKRRQSTESASDDPKS